MKTIDLETLTIERNSHRSRAQGMCAMEVVAYLAHEKHSDHPECASALDLLDRMVLVTSGAPA